MAEIIKTGSCGDNATFNLYDDGLLEILGTGAMTNYSYYSAVPWYDANFTRATIASGVTSIGNYAFQNCTGLTSITIPDSVTSIGQYAFRNCTGLTSITIPDSVTSIGWGAFYNCTGLTSITIPNSVTSIGSDAFSGCTGLTSITIPDSVTSIGNYAFQNCTGLANITIGNGVTNIGPSAFYKCTSLEKITLKGQPPTLSDTKVFTNTPIANGTGRINVPRRYLDNYTSDTNWGVFKVIIFGVETLAELFKEIADSIRAKKSTTAAICPYDYAAEIESIETGGKGGITEITSFADISFPCGSVVPTSFANIEF